MEYDYSIGLFNSGGVNNRIMGWLYYGGINIIEV